MNRFPDGYLKFELDHTKELVELHTKTKDEELRLLILEIRETLERIYTNQQVNQI